MLTAKVLLIMASKASNEIETLAKKYSFRSRRRQDSRDKCAEVTETSRSKEYSIDKSIHSKSKRNTEHHVSIRYEECQENESLDNIQPESSNSGDHDRK
ncbi:hypothetical protein ANN_12241 [Periplaneta americana]|uniref:Uncharacterized protein n=1 Tax=Periplaneta americana TaxID=6978 RepID=A0ABQ8THZ0_PERAM|nr:hypothetical protein ANN_12241 [Periplaneta americana]